MVLRFTFHFLNRLFQYDFKHISGVDYLLVVGFSSISFIFYMNFVMQQKKCRMETKC